MYGVDPKSGLWKLPSRYVGAYAEADVTQPLEILKRQEPLIKHHELERIWDLETDVLPVLVNMRRRGIRIDANKLREIEEWTLLQEAEALKTIKHKTGVSLQTGNIWEAKALVPVFDAVGINLSKTATGKPQINKEVFKQVDDPAVEALGWARKVNKLRTTFAASIRRYSVNGRIHCTFNQIAVENEAGEVKGVRFGRVIRE